MVLGGRDDAACRRLIDKVGVSNKTFVTDDREGYHRIIPERQSFAGKDLTFPIEQDNGNVRHYSVRTLRLILKNRADDPKRGGILFK